MPAPRVAVVGGGLAGLAVAAALAPRGVQVELFEARRRLGGRTASFRDAESGEAIDHCQHVSMGCCTNLADFARRVGIAHLFRRDRRLYFFGADGRQCDFASSGWLPAPAHLGPALWGLKFLSVADRAGIAQDMWALARLPLVGSADEPTVGRWLTDRGRSARAIELFWATVLVSALGESLDRASLFYAKKVFVDGFMVNRLGYEIEVPSVALGELYGDSLQAWLEGQGARLQLSTPIGRVVGDAQRVRAIELRSGETREFDFVVVAAPWRQTLTLLEALLPHLPEVAAAGGLQSAPISGVHLWFDRPLTRLPHAVLVGRLSQWMFQRGVSADRTGATEYYYQVVISASRSIAGQSSQVVAQQVCDELRSLWPEARDARLLRHRVVTEHEAVFSVVPGVDRLRPPQQTRIANLLVAGDWTATGWPATMEGAVRSGYRAAEAVLAQLGRAESIEQGDLAWSRGARLLLRRDQ